MDRKWVEMKEKETREKLIKRKQEILNLINDCDWLNDEAKLQLFEQVDKYENEPYHTANAMFLIIHNFVPNAKLDDIENLLALVNIDDYIMSMRYRGYGMYLDSEPVEFDGDIIITDPCYIIKHRDETTRPKWSEYMRLNDYRGMSQKELEEVGYFEDYKRMQAAMDKWDEEHPDDWDVCECGDYMDKLGLKTWMTRSTIYGDWGCTTFNSDTKEPIGKFCADAGMVGVFDLNEVLAYNPEYDDYTEKNWCVTLIKNFKGTVQFIVEEKKYMYDGKQYVDYVVRVVGRGVNKVTGEKLNFITSQTWL